MKERLIDESVENRQEESESIQNESLNQPIEWRDQKADREQQQQAPRDL